MKNLKNIFFLLAIVLIQTNTIKAQTIEKNLSQKDKKDLIDSVSVHLKSSYIFIEVAKEMATSIQSELKNGKYDAITDPQEMATILTTDLRKISKDQHLRVEVSQGVWPEQALSEEDRRKEEIERENYMKRENFGFKEVKIMNGNIGYIKLNGFFDVEQAKETVATAMTSLSNTDAIIFDLRQNGGGKPEMVQLISSYLFDSNPVHLNSLYWRDGEVLTEYWTLENISGTRNPDAAVYVLTSSRTFSAAEEFAYNLQNLKRATIIGETTGGGAHPGGMRKVTDKFVIFMPMGRAINPISKTNWEGTGVIPDISVAADQALKVAHTTALEKLALAAEDNN
jgi:C-terminal processing protease CtpA/Prc